MNKEGYKTKKVSILVRLLVMVLLPVVVMGAILSIYAAISMKKGMQSEIMSGLKAAAYSFSEIYNAMDAGDYSMNAEGKLLKGETDIDSVHTIADGIKKTTGYDVTLFYGDTRVITSVVGKETGERAVGTKASDGVIAEVLNKGNEFSSYKVDVDGENYYAYYIPVKNSDGTVIGMSFAGESSATIDNYIARKQTATVVVAGIILILAIAGTIAASRSLSNAIKSAETALKALASGDLTVEVDERHVGRNDEVGVMLQELVELKQKLKGVIGNIKESSVVLLNSGESLDSMASQSSSTADEISRAVEDISKGAMSQAEEIETASMNIGDMGTMIEQIAANVNQLDESSDKMKTASDQSQAIIQQLSDSNDKTTAAMQRIGKQIHATNDSVQTIRQAVVLITEIAAETSLLSLNASIEAARAGEHGRGFAVVASEIQKLADQSNTSATQIEKVIDELLKESETTVSVMDEVNSIVEEQQEKLNETKEKFADVIEGVNISREETRTIKNQTNMCDEARGNVDMVIQNLSAISEENAASTEETTASMEELNATINLLADAAKELKGLATNLEDEMQFFKL